MIRPSEKGFTLIEIIISILLISIVFVGSMLSYGTSMKTSFTNKAKNNAIRLAQQAIEDLKQYDQLNYDRNSLKSIPGVLGKRTPPSIDGITYTVNTEIINKTNLNSNIRNNNNYIPIRITVTWDLQGQQQLVVDTCLIKW